MQAQPSIRRRRMLQVAGALTAAPWPAAQAARAQDEAHAEARAFAASNFPDAIRALGGAPQPSGHITLQLPDVADNGAVVPVSVSSRLPGTREILIVVDGNPQPLAVRFTIPDGTEPFVATRIRMAGSGTVYAAVRTDDGLYAVARETEVSVSGCG